MSFWMPFMDRMKEEERIYAKMEEENKSREEIEIEELKKRQLTISQKLDMLGAQTIREYRDNQKRIRILQEEINFTKWFEENKKTIQRFFEAMKEHFLFDGEDIIYPRSADEDNVEFSGYILNREHLKKLLKRYNYIVKNDTDYTGKTTGLIIKFKKED